MNKLPYEIYHASEKRDSKSKNGDSLNYLELIEEKLVILCVSDGVGSLPNDWLASDTTCRVFVKKFIELSRTTESKIGLAVLEANNEVKALSENGRMAATLVGVVVDFNSDRINYVSIGDSRIFIVDCNGVNLITKDDTMSIPVKINNEILVKDGVPVYSFPITKAIGQNEKLEFEINSKPFNAGETLILATDGIHNHGVLPYNILDLINQKNISARLPSVVSECSRENNDDATILILRRKDFPSGSKSLYKNAIIKNLDYESEKLYGHLLTNSAIELVEENISMKDWGTVKDCLEYIYVKKLFPPRDILISWLNNIVTQNINDTNILMTLRKLIQISS